MGGITLSNCWLKSRQEAETVKQGLDKVAPYQKYNFRASCRIRPSAPEFALEITPSVAVSIVCPGIVKRGWLKRSKDSARNCTLLDSVIRKFLKSERSKLNSPGPISTFLPELPKLYGDGSTNAEVSNQRATVRSDDGRLPS